MNTLFDNIYGANFTRAIINGDTPKKEKWITPFFTDRTDALLFQDILINKLAIEPTPEAKQEIELMKGDMYFNISMSVLMKLREDVECFLAQKTDSMSLSDGEVDLYLCGLGSAGVPRLYNQYNQYMTPTQIVEFLNGLQIAAPDKLSLYITSNASAASRNYTFDSMEQMHQQFEANLRGNNSILASLIGTEGSLTSEIYRELTATCTGEKAKFTQTNIYGYLFPYITQGAEAYGTDISGKGLSQWKTLSMAAVATVFTEDKKYYQQVPVRRSLTKVKF